MGLRARLLVGLSVLVTAAIGSTGWLCLSAAGGRLERAEAERARGVAEAAAGVLGAAIDDPARLRAAAARLREVRGLTALSLLDARGAVLVGPSSGDAALPSALAGAVIEKREGRALVVFAPLRRDDAGGAHGPVVGALELRLAGSAAPSDALRATSGLLVALTLVDGGLILLFGALFLRGVLRPLEATARAAGRVAAGDLDGPAVDASAGGELGALAAAFNQMTGSLRGQRRALLDKQAELASQEKLATVGRLAAGVAHEVGNPLTAVLGYVDLLLAGERDPAARDLLGRVQAETGRIHRLVHELLDYARPVDDRLEPVALREVVEAACALLRPQPRARDVTIEDAVPPSLPAAAAAAPRVLQIVLNLMLNAADAVARVAGERRVRVEGGVIHNNGIDSVFVDVIDSGPGVADADRARLFDPFFTTKEPGQGTGLGLAVSRSIAAAFAGSLVLVDPAPTGRAAADRPSGRDAASPRGARFRLVLPAWPPDRAPSARTESPPR